MVVDFVGRVEIIIKRHSYLFHNKVTGTLVYRLEGNVSWLVGPSLKEPHVSNLLWVGYHQ